MVHNIWPTDSRLPDLQVTHLTRTAFRQHHLILIEGNLRLAFTCLSSLLPIFMLQRILQKDPKSFSRDLPKCHTQHTELAAFVVSGLEMKIVYSASQSWTQCERLLLVLLMAIHCFLKSPDGLTKTPTQAAICDLLWNV